MQNACSGVFYAHMCLCHTSVCFKRITGQLVHKINWLGNHGFAESQTEIDKEWVVFTIL